MPRQKRGNCLLKKFDWYYSNIFKIVEQNSRNSHILAKANPPNIATLFTTGLAEGCLACN